MLLGRDTIRSVGVWSLGDGKTIKPFVDPWIPRHYERRLGQHPVTEPQAEIRVEEWIDNETRTWKESVVREALSWDEAHTVIQVPILAEPREDELNWLFGRGGAVTARLAYHFIR